MMVLVVLALAVAVVGAQDVPVLQVPTAWSALGACSAYFGSNLPWEVASVDEPDLAGLVVTLELDERPGYESVVATGTVSGEPRRDKAVWRGPRAGCVLVHGNRTEEDLRAEDLGDVSALPPPDASVPFPAGDYVDPESIPPEVDTECLRRVVRKDFLLPLAKTRSILVVYDGQIVYEKYASFINQNTPLLGWSSTKSINHALAGVLALAGELDIHEPVGKHIQAWSDPSDLRYNITADMMMRMASGSPWTESYDLIKCLYGGHGDCAGFAANLRPDRQVPPDTEFLYSTGESCIVSELMDAVRTDAYTNAEWPQKRLFERLHMNSAYIETQPNGHITGGSYGYMSARDWARLGLLYMRDGIGYDAERILPEGWVDYARTATDLYKGYGSGFWLDPTPSAPDEFEMRGFRNQHVIMIPSRKLLITRHSMPSIRAFGEGKNPLIWNKENFIESVLECIKS